MNRKDAEAIITLLKDLDANMHRMRASGAEATDEKNIVARFYESVEGTPGSGVCICRQSPKSLRAFAERCNEDFAHCTANMLLDHRCVHHGEKAQPALWGRHKEKELAVTGAQWLSLGVEYDT